MTTQRKPTSFWNNFATVEREIRDFIAKHHTDNIMPTSRELAVAGRRDLAHAIAKHGGFPVVANRLGLKYASGSTGDRKPAGSRKPAHFWDSFANLEKELRVFITERGTSNSLPTKRELTTARRKDLVHAINKHGGTVIVAKRLNLTRENEKRPTGYWDNFANVEKELRAFVTKHDKADCFPTQNELIEAKRHDLSNAIRKHGGFSAVAQKLGLKRSDVRKPAGYWDNFDNVKKELIRFVIEHGTDSVMPNANDLYAAQQNTLVTAIGRHGGFRVVASMLGLQQKDRRKLASYWDDFGNVEKELRAFVAEHGAEGIMPSSNQLTDAGRGVLSRAISKHGGFLAVAARLGLQLSQGRKPIGYWDDLANVEKDLRAFIAEHGKDGIMPTQSELVNAGQHSISQAIGKHGGFYAVAKRFGLERSDDDKPSLC